MYKNKSVGVVVPAYNEEKFIASVIKNVPEIVDRIYIVNDASTDSTKKIVESLLNKEKRVVLLNHELNKGVGAAIVAGYKKAIIEKIDAVVVMAGDNQMDGKYLPALLDPIVEDKAEYTKGNRLSRLSHRHGMSNWRFFGNWLLTFLTRIATGYWKIGDPQNGYTAISKDALMMIDLDAIYPRYGYPNDMLAKLNVADCRVIDVPMPSRYGSEKSKIKYRTFITKVSFLLLRSYLWRLKVKYFQRQQAFHKGDLALEKQ